MRVLVLSPRFPVSDLPHYAPAVVDTLSRLSRFHDLEVHATSAPTALFGLSAYRGIDVMRYGRGTRASRALSVIEEVLVRHRARRFDVVWAMWIDRSGPFAVLLSRLLRAPLIASILGGELACLPSFAYGFATTRARRAFLSGVLACAALITVGSERLRDRVAELARSAAPRVRVLPFGTPAEEVAVRAPGTWASPRPLRAVVVSDLSPVKRVDLAVDAVRWLRERGIAVSLDVYGAAADLSLFAGMPAVHHGFVAAGELRRALATYDVLLHPSAHESQGCALVEAALAELPIAAYDVGVAAELSRLGANVVLASRADAAAFAEASIRAASQLASPGARERVAARFGLEAAADGFRRALEEAFACASS